MSPKQLDQLEFCPSLDANHGGTLGWPSTWHNSTYIKKTQIEKTNSTFSQIRFLDQSLKSFFASYENAKHYGGEKVEKPETTDKNLPFLNFVTTQYWCSFYKFYAKKTLVDPADLTYLNLPLFFCSARTKNFSQHQESQLKSYCIYSICILVMIFYKNTWEKLNFLYSLIIAAFIQL